MFYFFLAWAGLRAAVKWPVIAPVVIGLFVIAILIKPALLSKGRIRLLRILLLAELFFLAVGLSAIAVFFTTLPADLQANWKLESDKGFGVADYLSLAAVATYLLGMIGCWRIRQWGRILYTIGIGSVIALTAFTEPDILPSVAQALSDASVLTSGAVILLMWSNMEEEFTHSAGRVPSDAVAG
jgi:hypothetical protein